MRSLALRLVSASAQLSGALLAVLAVAELLDPDSGGSKVTGPLRIPFLVIAAGAAVLALISGVRDVLGRSERWPLSIVRDLVVLGVLAIAAQAMLTWTFRPVLLNLCLGAAAGAFAVLRLGERVRERLGTIRPIRVLEIGLFQACLIVVGLEVGLRAVALLLPTPLLALERDKVVDRIERHRYAPGTLRFGFRCNAGGHYDEEFTPGAVDRMTIVSIGDSFSASVVPHRFHFTTVAEHVLDGAVIHNLGFPTIGPGGYLHLLREEGLQLEPDLILVNLFVGNDVMEASRWNARVSTLESWCDRRYLLVWQLPGRLLRLWEEGSTVHAHSLGRLPGETALEQPTNDEAQLNAALPWLSDPTGEPPTLSAEAFLRMEAKRAAVIHSAKDHGHYGLFDALSEIKKAAGETRLVVMLIPDEFQVEDALWTRVQDTVGVPDLDREEPQRAIRRWLEEQGTPYVDLLPILRRVPRLEDGQRHLYHRNDSHFNARGNKIAGEALAEFLQTQLR